MSSVEDKQDNFDLEVIDQEFYDMLEGDYLRGRRVKPPHPDQHKVNRNCKRWKRMRASLCEHHGLDEDLDEYCDRVYRLVPR